MMDGANSPTRAGTVTPFRAPDGLALAAQVWPGPDPEAPVVLCLHGLTRNSRDFDLLAARLSRDHAVVAPDQRGRGLSAHDPDLSHYNPFHHVQDMWALLEQLRISQVLVIGTSMGALMAVIMANQAPDRIVGMVLNDAGPEIDPRGVARIRSYAGPQEPIASWSDAVARIRSIHGAVLPTYTELEWDRLARATYVERNGQLEPDYDPAIATAFASTPVPDLWPAFGILDRVPTLLLRGALSDLLSAGTVEQVKARYPMTDVVIVPDRGHAPDLSEPSARSAIDAFLAREDVKARW